MIREVAGRMNTSNLCDGTRKMLHGEDVIWPRSNSTVIPLICILDRSTKK